MRKTKRSVRLAAALAAVLLGALCLGGCRRMTYGHTAETAAPDAVYPLHGRTYDENDRLLLAQFVAGEMGEKPYVCQTALAAVVLNRVNDARFPDALEDVIFGLCGENAGDGRFSTVPPDSALRCAADALLGLDPSGGALYVYMADDEAACRRHDPYRTLRIAGVAFARQ